MQTLPLENFGSLGAQAVDINLQTASDEELKELGELVLNKLVVYVNAENASVTPERFQYIQTRWGDPISSDAGKRLEERVKKDGWNKLYVETARDMKAMRKDMLPGMIRVTGIKDKKGNRTGMFADGELDWHSNQQSDNDGYAPLIGLQGVEGTEGSSTEFLQTVDALNDLENDTRSEVEQLIAIHSFGADRISRGTSKSQALITNLQLVPEDNTEMPVLAIAPNGDKGMHFPWTSIVGFKDYTQEEFEKLFNYLVEHLWQDKYVYKHMWQDGEIVWMDQIVTLHRRPGSDTSKRLLHRMCSNWSNIIA
jgi:alpha-ketoglutarate-dependent taurine dioxygenase|tara:strand:+ start:2362 stop:3288 length:927 start_codon:yes stop_codon:yes gene_type:complete